MNKIGNIEGKSILLLQGPMGSFFKELDRAFRKRGAVTYKIGFNMGDAFYSNRDNYIPYRDKPERWQAYIRHFLEEKRIDMIFLFGDCRFYQRIAIRQSLKENVEIFVFEEGYLRPDFITLERYGVNGFSKLSREPEFYLHWESDKHARSIIIDAQTKYYRKALSATVYYILSGVFHFLYPRYRHHRHFNFAMEAFWGARNAFRKLKYRYTERHLSDSLVKEWSKSYYFVPLQTYNDFQLRKHSSFASIESFIGYVIHSFALNAPKDTLLILKHHPEDRGRKDYRKHIEKQAEKYDIAQRVVVVYDLHLPTCLKHAIGTVTINSTVGLSSLYHGIPTITLGSAIYDIRGLTCYGMSLDNFWTDYILPDHLLYDRFRDYLIEHTQLNGSFYGRFPEELLSSPDM